MATRVSIVLPPRLWQREFQCIAHGFPDEDFGFVYPPGESSESVHSLSIHPPLIHPLKLQDFCFYFNMNSDSEVAGRLPIVLSAPKSKPQMLGVA